MESNVGMDGECENSTKAKTPESPVHRQKRGRICESMCVCVSVCVVGGGGT